MAKGRRYTYPLGDRGKLIGRPYQGTHGKQFNVRGGSDNWESENAVDISTPVGTPVYAVTDGTIGSQIGSLGSGGRFAGLRLHLVGGGNEFYYAHLSKLVVHAGERVKAGQLLGYSGEANGVAHLHFASKTGNPLSITQNGQMGAPQAQPTQEQPSRPASAGAPPATQASAAPPQPVVDQNTLDQFQSDLTTLENNQPALDTGVVEGPLVGQDQGLSGSNQPYGATSQSPYSLWQMIAANGNSSAQTQYLAGLASLTANG